jgi:hypothetical protein
MYFAQEITVKKYMPKKVIVSDDMNIEMHGYNCLNIVLQLLQLPRLLIQLD